MKYPIVSSASLLALAMSVPAFGQTTLPVPEPDECAGAAENCIVIEQDGSSLGALVTQTGTEGVAVIRQVELANGDTAEISQAAATNDNFGEIRQIGDGLGGATMNIAEIRQVSGDGNASLLIQGDTTSFGGTIAGATNSDATSRQQGDTNQSFILQGGDNQLVFVNQTTSVATSVVVQGDFGGDDNIASVGQQTDSSLAIVFQNSSSGSADIQQRDGSGNISAIDQGFVDGAGAGADGNDAVSLQEGSQNDSTIEQNLADVGGLNFAQVFQLGDANASTVAQEGTGNSAEVTQYDDNASFVTQDGTGNAANVTQGVPSGGGGPVT